MVYGKICFIPDYHYIHIKDDYSDLEEKLKFYIKNTEKLQQISINANNYVDQFRDYNDENYFIIGDGKVF